MVWLSLHVILLWTLADTVTVDGSDRWYEFLTVIGKKITLDGWKDYAGGLDVSGGMCSL